MFCSFACRFLVLLPIHIMSSLSFTYLFSFFLLFHDCPCSSRPPLPLIFSLLGPLHSSSISRLLHAGGSRLSHTNYCVSVCAAAYHTVLLWGPGVTSTHAQLSPAPSGNLLTCVPHPVTYDQPVAWIFFILPASLFCLAYRKYAQ